MLFIAKKENQNMKRYNWVNCNMSFFDEIAELTET